MTFKIFVIHFIKWILFNLVDFDKLLSFYFQQWFFSTAMEPIKRWVFEGKAKVSEHLKVCPYNVRTCHSDVKKKDPKWDNVMKTLVSRLELKRKSQWFLWHFLTQIVKIILFNSRFCIFSKFIISPLYC